MTHAVVVGLAETGVAVAHRLREEGWTVTVIEDRPVPGDRYRSRVAAMRAIGATVVEEPDATAAGALATEADLVVPSPLVAPTHVVVRAANAAGVPVRSEIDLAAERSRAVLVAVTGTNGKTTVTSMITAMLEASGRRAVAAGNIGRPLIEAVSDDADVIVAEVSSFQLAFTESFRPAVAVLLAITPDHLDWHGSFDAYVAAKARITTHQHADDLLVYDADDLAATAVAAWSPARTVGVTVGGPGGGAAGDCYRVADGALLGPDGEPIARLEEMRRSLLHDRTNALAATAAAAAVGANLGGIRATLATYATMPHRVSLVGEANGVQWYDDSKATNPDAVLRAVASFDSVVLLAGGRNKGLDLSVLAGQRDRLRGVVAFGEAAPEVAGAFAGTNTRVVSVTSMREAVRAADAMARRGDVVLLSPACASFDAYDNYGQRGDDFAAEFRAQVRGEAAAK